MRRDMDGWRLGPRCREISKVEGGHVMRMPITNSCLNVVGSDGRYQCNFRAKIIPTPETPPFHTLALVS